MEILHSLMLAVHLLTAISIVVLVLLQQGKGADMGAAFGTGSAGSVFGAAGSANFLSRSTAVAATVFFATSVALTYYGAKAPSASGGVMQGVSTSEPAKKEAAVPGKAPATGAPAEPKQDVPK
ncbi:MAG: preprotein translocase subunit SecG [Burkholderiales bacterium]|nr:MAG: preprotein translocase subunit SecG [Burkholderiales bacterium]TAG77059.1 MAG: preprotein translocase subunit SecG [Betaproteobacteria bacterium]